VVYTHYFVLKRCVWCTTYILCLY